MRVLAALALSVLAPILAAQDTTQPNSDLPFADSDIRRVLILARDAALQQQRVEDGTLGGSLPGSLRTLMTGFRAIDDWQDAVVLQKRVSKVHKADVLCAPPHATPGDYERIRHSAAQIDSGYARDNALQRLVPKNLPMALLTMRSSRFPPSSARKFAPKHTRTSQFSFGNTDRQISLGGHLKPPWMPLWKERIPSC